MWKGKPRCIRYACEVYYAHNRRRYVTGYNTDQHWDDRKESTEQHSSQNCDRQGEDGQE